MPRKVLGFRLHSAIFVDSRRCDGIRVPGTDSQQRSTCPTAMADRRDRAWRYSAPETLSGENVLRFPVFSQLCQSRYAWRQRCRSHGDGHALSPVAGQGPCPATGAVCIRMFFAFRSRTKSHRKRGAEPRDRHSSSLFFKRANQSDVARRCRGSALCGIFQDAKVVAGQPCPSGPDRQAHRAAIDRCLLALRQRHRTPGFQGSLVRRMGIGQMPRHP